MSEQTEDRRLPETWEEYDRGLQRARREGFCRGARVALQHCLRPSEIGEESIRSYPITQMVPRKVSLFGDTTARMDGCGGVWFEDERGESISKPHLCPESAAALRDLLNRPYDEVPE